MTPIDITDGVVLLSAPTSGDVDRITHTPRGRGAVRPAGVHLLDEEALGVGAPVGARHGRPAGHVRVLAQVREPSTGVLCGTVRVDLVADAEIGFWIGAPSRGRGWATRAARLACASAFSHGVDHVRWKAIVGNEASLRVASKVGFRLEGTVRRLIVQRGEWRDGWIGTLLPHELRWPPTAPPGGN